MRHTIDRAGLGDRITCDSAGTSSYHVGNPPDRRMQAAAKTRGIVLEGRSRQFVEEDFDRFDLILAMDSENYRDILSLDRSRQYRDKVRLMCEFCTHHAVKEVPDPYYGGPEGFDRVIDLLLDACEGLLAYLRPQFAQR